MLKKLCIILIVIVLNIRVFASAEEVQSPNIICIDRETERVLYNKGGFERKKIASLTKVITAIVVCENIELDKEIEVSKNAAGVGGSTVGIKAGDKIKVENLLYGLLLCSGNDCAIALAEGVGGSVENFAMLMNNKAKEIGAKDSNFVTPHGLDKEEHYSTCMDMAKITNYALENKIISKIVKTKTKEVNFGSFNKSIKNTNRLLHTYDNITGVKTGFTNGANRCLIASAKEEFEVICVVLGSETTDIRFNDAYKIIEDTFAKYKVVDISKQMRWYVNIKIEKGNKPEYIDYVKGNLKLPLTEQEVEEIMVRQEFIPKLTAPVKKGMPLGIIELYIGDERIYTQNVYLKEDIKKLEIKDYMLDGFKNIFNANLT